MSGTELEHLITMINQIADNIVLNSNEDDLAPKVADHVRKFWARPMKEQIIRYAAEEGEQLHPVALAAVELIK